jgi:zinc protease
MMMMMMRFRRMQAALLVAPAILSVACSASAPPVQPAQAPSRAARPALAATPVLRLPQMQQFTLPNGMRVVLMEKRDLPLVQVLLSIDAGSVHDNARLGLASLTAAMLDEGAAGKNALQIADEFEVLGARFSVGAGLHHTTISLRASTPRIDAAMKLASDVLLRPDFPAAELDRLRIERLTGLVRRHDDPNSIAGVLADETLFGKQHPYGRSAIGSEATLREMTVDHLRSFYRTYFAPARTTAIIVGDIDAAGARRLLETSLGSWNTANDVRGQTLVPNANQVSGRVIYLVDKPGSAQSVIRLGRIGVPRNTRDYFALEVMNTILGGSFTSRLNQNLREKHGYAYGASSGFSYLPFAGPWVAASAVQTQSTGPALMEFMNELRNMRQPIPAAEVERARNFLAMRYPAGFQSVSGIAARLGELVQFGLPLDYFNTYVQNVLAVTPADVERVARQYIDPENVTIFVVGDRKVVEPQIRAQNLGELRLLEVTDVLGPIPQLR